ncbi:MAG: Fe-S protein assembly co-chaperone HscB [Candidatus Rokuibacteriota bacterium]
MGRLTVKCRGCGADTAAAELCPECGRLQPFPAGADHWVVLGLERRLSLDRADLERRFHELNRRLHPDYFRLRPEEEQAISLDTAAAVNTAYRTLREPASRVEYLLELEGMGLGTAGQARPPADLFEEIMEVQEARQELPTAGAAEAPALKAHLLSAREDLAARRARTETDLAGLLPGWDEAVDGERRALLGPMRDVLAMRAYLRTVLRDLDQTLEAG